jgi:hypothetical protein
MFILLPSRMHKPHTGLGLGYRTGRTRVLHWHARVGCARMRRAHDSHAWPVVSPTSPPGPKRRVGRGARTPMGSMAGGPCLIRDMHTR